MAYNSKKKIKHNPWGDDHPEKLTQSPRITSGFKQQLKGLFNPENFANQIFNRQKDHENYPTYQPPERAVKRETLIFSRQSKEEEVHIQRETKEILEKLKEQVALLEKSEKSLTSQISKITVEQVPKKSGIYYLLFFEWLINLVKQLRMKIDEGRLWLTTFTQRKKKRLGYWKMYKKHGTTFGLSHERTLATQTG